MTGRIRYLQDEHSKNPDERKRFVILKELIDRRKKMLKWLRGWDYRRFEWLLEKLDLEYKPQPLVLFNIFRRDSMVRLTNQHCEQLRNNRLEEYKQKLQSQQVDFLAEKLTKLKFIREEQLALGIDATVSDTDIAKVQKQHDELKRQREEESKGKDLSNKWKMY